MPTKTFLLPLRRRLTPMLSALGLFSLLGLTSCQGTWLDTQGGVHKEADRMATARLFYGDPISGKALAWHGIGEVPNFGASVHNHWFTSDRVAVGLGLSLMQFKPPGRRVTGGELEARFRYYFAEWRDIAFFGDFNCGYMRTQAQIPPGGTRGNFTFSFGPGAEIPIDQDTSLLCGVEFHHMSNALGRESSRNPSQNEFLLWVGLGIDW